MYRTLIKELHKWKENKNKKPILIHGARGVGKTWLMKEFGKIAFEKTIYINFDNNQRMQSLFSCDFNIERIITGLSLYSGQKIDPLNTLLIFDEIQSVPQVLDSLKYFNENEPLYQIICAGTPLKVFMDHEASSFAGNVTFVDLHPLSFIEFLMAMGHKYYAKILNQGDFEMITTFKQDYIEMLKHYIFVGGMPEVVMSFSENKDFIKVRAIQQRILLTYEQDFSKNAPNALVPRIRTLWQIIPAQLSKENKKFIYGLIKEGARAKDYELALVWLTDCGFVHKIPRVSKPSFLLKVYVDLKAFKLFFLDVGLLSCILGLDEKVLLDENAIFKKYNNALTVQFILQQLKTMKKIETYYWTNDRGSAEIDFLVNNGSDVFPVEVKAEANLKAKSLKIYHEKFQPKISIRTTIGDYNQEDWLINLPLYAIETIENVLNVQ